MKLSVLLKEVNCLTEYEDTEITDIVSDSRKVTPGCLFICIKGLTVDGHKYAAKAAEQGAKVIIAEKDTGLSNQILVPGTREAFAKISAAFFGHPAKKLKLLGVTGTNGKTTTTYLLKHILEANGHNVGLIGTIQNMIKDRKIKSELTTPDSYELNRLFAKMVEQNCECVVMEVSSHALEQGRVDGLNYEAAIFTNLTQDHLDFHGNMDNYYKAKLKLFQNSKQAIINFDDPYAARFLADINIPVTTFSAKNDDADFTAKNIKMHVCGVNFELVGMSVISRIRLAIPGMFSVYNAMGAAVCAIKIGIPLDIVVDALKTMKGVPGRIELVPTDADFHVIIDYAHTPDALEKVLTAVRAFAPGRIVTIFGCGGERDIGKRPIMGEIAAKYSDFVIVSSDNPRSEDPTSIIRDTVEGMKNYDTPYIEIEDRAKAVEFAVLHAQPDDIIVLAGKGHEDYQVLKEGTVHLDEREIVRDILNRRKAGKI